jgi:hypothetical protein
MGPLATIACASLLAALLGRSARVGLEHQDEQSAPLSVVVTDAVTGEPLPGADVRWLPLTLHDAAVAVAGFDWPRDQEAAVLRAGARLTLDAAGRARIDAPLGGLIVLARTNERYLLREVASGASEVALALELDVSLTVTILQTSGAPLVGALAGLWTGTTRHGSGAVSARALSGSTDSSGTLTFHRIQTKVPELATFLARGDLPPPLHVELDVVGERVVFPLEPAALAARAATFTVPPLGVVAVRLVDIGADGRRAAQAVEVREVEPGRPEARGARFSGAVDGVIRRCVPLGRRFEVRVLDRRVLGLLTTVVEGPRAEGEVVEVGPLTPDDHVELRLVTGLSPLDLPADSVIRVSQGAASGFGITTLERVMFGPKDLGAEGELTLLVPRVFLERPSVVLRASLSAGGRVLGAVDVDVTEGLAAGARMTAPLGAALASPPEATPEVELLVDGLVVDVAGRPVPGAHITVLEDDPTAHSENFRFPPGRNDTVVRTDAQGRFALRYATDARRFQMRVGGAGFATPRVVLAERGERDVRVMLGAATQLSARVILDDDVPSERIVVDLVEHTDGVRSTSARRMHQVGRGMFVVETRDTGPAELRVHSSVTVTWPGQDPRAEELLVASLTFELGDTPGAVHAPDIDLRGQLVRLDPRAVDAATGAPLTGATYAFDFSTAARTGRSFVGVPVGEATFVPVGEVTLAVDAPGRIPVLGAPGQEEFALVEAPRVVLTLEDEHGAPPPADWQFSIGARLAPSRGADGPAFSLLRRSVERDQSDTPLDRDRRTLSLRHSGRWALTCTARRHDTATANYGVPLDAGSAHVVVPDDTPPGAVLVHRVRMAAGALAALPTQDRPPPTLAAPTPLRAVVDLELCDAEGLSLARREVHARWVWPGMPNDGGASRAWPLYTDVLGRASLAADGVPLEHEELELELATDPSERPMLHARVCWRAREARRSSLRPQEQWTTVAGVGAVWLGALEPAVTGRVLDRAGQPVVGARLVVADARRAPGAPQNAALWVDTLRGTECDAEGRFELYSLSGTGPLQLSAVDLPDGSVRLDPNGVTHMTRGARDVIVEAERLATVVVVLALDDGVGPSHVEVALVGDDGERSKTFRLFGEGGELRYEFRGVEPGLYTQQISIAESLRPYRGSEQSSRTLYESALAPLEWSAAGPTILPMIDLTGQLALTQITFALDGAAASLWLGAELERCMGIVALDGARMVDPGVTVGDVWLRAHDPERGCFELLTRSRTPLALEVAGSVSVRGDEGEYRSLVVRSAPGIVGAGMAAAVVSLEELSPLHLSVSKEIVEALGPHHLYAIAWRNVDGAVAHQISPTWSFGELDAQGELVLRAPEPRPGMGATTVEVELVLASNPGQMTRNLAAALDFPRVRREMAAHFAVGPDGERMPKHVPRAERVLELDAREQPIPWRQVLDTTTSTPIQLDVTVAAVRAARTLLERE